MNSSSVNQLLLAENDIWIMPNRMVNFDFWSEGIYSRAIKVILACKGVHTNTNSLMYCTLLHDAHFGRYDPEIDHPVRHDPFTKNITLCMLWCITSSLLKHVDIG